MEKMSDIVPTTRPVISDGHRPYLELWEVEILERCEAASAWPWQHHTQDGKWLIHQNNGGGRNPTLVEFRKYENAENDSKFAAFARSDIPSLFSTVAALRRENKTLLDKLHHLHAAAAKPDPSRVVTGKRGLLTAWTGDPTHTRTVYLYNHEGPVAVVDFFTGTVGPYIANGDRETMLPLTKPLPPGTADRIDAYLDALAPAAAKGEAKAWTFESMPVAVKVRLACGAGRSVLAVPANEDNAMIVGEGSVGYGVLLRDYEQLDGSPCGPCY